MLRENLHSMKKIAFIFILSFSFANAYTGCYSKGCTQFDGTTNKHGAILKSTGIQYKWIGYGVGSSMVKIKNAKKLKPITIHLGRSCDASSKEYGKGQWSWANGGFWVKFKNEEFAFERQELDIKTDVKFGFQM